MDAWPIVLAAKAVKFSCLDAPDGCTTLRGWGNLDADRAPKESKLAMTTSTQDILRTFVQDFTDDTDILNTAVRERKGLEEGIRLPACSNSSCTACERSCHQYHWRGCRRKPFNTDGVPTLGVKRSVYDPGYIAIDEFGVGRLPIIQLQFSRRA